MIYGRRERKRGMGEVNGKGCFSLFCVCVCIKNGKGRVRGMLGLGQRDGVSYKRITPNIRQNRETFFVFTSFSLCFLLFFSCFACCFCCCFSCTTSFWHFPTLGNQTPLSLSLCIEVVTSEKKFKKKNEKKKVALARPLAHDACAVKLYSIIGRWRMHNRQNQIPFGFISMYVTATVKKCALSFLCIKYTLCPYCIIIYNVYEWSTLYLQITTINITNNKLCFICFFVFPFFLFFVFELKIR